MDTMMHQTALESIDASVSSPTHRGAPAFDQQFYLHPFYVWRIAGEPASLLEGLVGGETAEHIAQLKEMRLSVNRLTEQAIAAIARNLARVYDNKKARRAHLQVKRDIYAGRPSREEHLAEVIKNIEDEDGKSRVALVASALKEITQAENALQRCFDQENTASQAALAKLFDRKNLANGISFTNPRLYRTFCDRYDGAYVGPENKAARALDDSFMQYVSRACLKTSPFSSFTPLLLGRWNEASPNLKESMRINLAEVKLQRKIALNSALIQDLVGPALKALPLNPETRLYLNQSVRREGGSLRFHRRREELSVKGMTWGVELEELSLPWKPALESLLELYRRAGSTGLTFKELEARYAGDLTSEQLTALRHSLQTFFAVGLLLRLGGWLEQEAILPQAIQLIESGSNQAGKMVGRLREMEQMLGRYTESCDIERAKLVDSLASSAQALAEEEGTEITSIRKGGAAMLFEDCFLDAPGGKLPKALPGPVLEGLKNLMRISPIFEYGGPLQSWLADSFVAEFGHDGVCASPREFFKSRMNLINGGIVAPWNMGLIYRECSHARKLLQLRVRFMEHLVDNIDAMHESRLDENFLMSLADELPEPVKNRPVSHSFLGQFCSRKDGTDDFVINQILSGNSQLISRFLDPADQHGIESVAKYLRQGARTGRGVDLAGVFGFNANVHAQILDEELIIPPYPPGFADSGKLRLDELRLRYDSNCHRVQLIDSNEQPLDVFYLGLLTPVLMPQLHRAISGLSAQSPFFFFNSIEGTLRSRGMETNAEALILPRVRLGKLLLTRKTWITDVANLRFDATNKLQAFRELNGWHRRLALPEDVFLRFMPGQDGMKGDKEETWKDFDRTKLKPFYINFKSPQFSNQLFRRLNSGLYQNHKLLLSEVLPAVTDQHLRMGNDRHVAELQLELTMKPRERDEHAS